MSKLDDIFDEYDRTYNSVWGYKTAKQQIKDLYLGLIGEDEDQNPLKHPVAVELEAFAHNQLRAKLRQKINDL